MQSYTPITYNGSIFLDAQGATDGSGNAADAQTIQIQAIVKNPANVFIFVMTEDVNFPMVLFDKWTAVNAVLLVIEIFAMIFSKKT
ncbi:MAG: hypothetical protein LBN22_03010, partial [Clostridiales Family XIII bacterium]|nr:hypothetical protein [Clostridiales Family XIII bacterium]